MWRIALYRFEYTIDAVQIYIFFFNKHQNSQEIIHILTV